MDGPGPGEVVAGLGSRLRERRRELGLRQEDVADLAGCSTRFVHQVEAGKPSAQLDKLVAVLEVVGLGLAVIDADDLTAPGRGTRAPGGGR